MLHTSEQFATEQLMEHHENVAHGVDRQTDKQTDENVKQPAAAPRTTSTSVKPADSKT